MPRQRSSCLVVGSSHSAACRVEQCFTRGNTAQGGVGSGCLKLSHKIAIGTVALVAGSALVATRPGSTDEQEKRAQIAHARLAQVTPAARHDVNYKLLDARLTRLMDRPTMVGMAIGVVENGRITFLKGYGETLARSGDPVTAETVFRWASCSKGVAATMVAKLAEQGKVDLDAPIS